MERSGVAAEAAGLVKRYGDFVAVKGISLQINFGEVFGLLGPNGAGKTTTIGMMLGVLKPSEGTVHLFGEELCGNEPKLLRRVGALVETPTFYPYMCARDNLRVLAMIDGKATDSEISRVLDLTDLTAAKDKPFRTYSLGMKQRLGIAAALLCNPDMIILDEPTNGLDPAGIVEIRALLRKLADEGKAVVLSSHQLNEVQRICDRVAIISQGRVVADGNVADLVAERRKTTVKASDTDKALLIIEQFPWVSSLKIVGDRIEIGGTAPDPFVLSQTLAESGVWLSEIGTADGTLEDYFLALTTEVGAGRQSAIPDRLRSSAND